MWQGQEHASGSGGQHHRAKRLDEEDIGDFPGDRRANKEYSLAWPRTLSCSSPRLLDLRRRSCERDGAPRPGRRAIKESACMSEIFERIADTDMLYKSTADEHSLVRSTEGELLDMSWQIFKDATKALDEKPTALEVGEREPLVEIALRHLTILKRILRQRNASGVRLAMAQRGQASSFKTVLTVDATSRLIDDGRRPRPGWQEDQDVCRVGGATVPRRCVRGQAPAALAERGPAAPVQHAGHGVAWEVPLRRVRPLP